MVAQALRDKLRQRGPLGIAKDAAELGLSCYIIGVWEFAMLGAVITGGIVAAPFLAYALLTKERP